MKKAMLGLGIMMGAMTVFGAEKPTGEVGYNLFKIVNVADKNVMISPYSILEALRLVQNGADGGTLKEFEEVLGDYDKVLNNIKEESTVEEETEDPEFVTLEDEGVDNLEFKFNTANSLWLNTDYDFHILPSYSYDGDVFEESFSKEGTLEKVNDWVKEETSGMIPNMLNELDGNLILLNAVAFESRWSDKFTTIGEKDFTNSNDEVVKAETMLKTLKSYKKLKDGGLAVDFWYKGGKFKYIAILPPEGTKLEDYIKDLSYKDIVKAKVKEGNAFKDLVVPVEMPKYSYEYSVDLTEPLKELGIKSCFSRETSNLSRLSSTPTYVSDVIHKTYIDVDEYGTKAAASTAVIAELSAKAPKKQEIKEILFNRPFMYIITDAEESMPIFIGTVNNVKGK